MKALNHPAEGGLPRLGANVLLLLIWSGLIFLCGLFALAIHDYELRNQAQLESAHTAGMAIGSTMCGRYAQ